MFLLSIYPVCGVKTGPESDMDISENCPRSRKPDLRIV